MNIFEYANSVGIKLNEAQQAFLVLRMQGVESFVYMPPYQRDVVDTLWNDFTFLFPKAVKATLDK